MGGRIAQALAALAITAAITQVPAQAQADEVFLAAGAIGSWLEDLKVLVRPWEERTGNKVTLVPMPSSTSEQFAQYRLWLAAGTRDVDLYQTDVIWAPQMAVHFVDLTEAARDLIPQSFPAVIESQTVDGRLVALPLFADAPALFYRSDLLEKYGREVPASWDELTATAEAIQKAEREAGARDLWGFVWQGNAYEGLTCNALEWIASEGGGHIVEEDGRISVNNPEAARAIDRAAGWVGRISPRGVLAYQEEEARGVWQTGNAVFMRNWAYAYNLGNGKDSAIRGKFDVAPLPAGPGGAAGTLGGWNLAVSKYSPHREAAISLALFLGSPEVQKQAALVNGNLPTFPALYDDPDIAREVPMIPRWKAVFEQAVPRPSAPTRNRYNEVSARFWSAVHQTLSGQGTAAENLARLEMDLAEIKGDGW